MKASIFIPTKNAGPCFGKTLGAIFEQKHEDLEVIIVDSGSIDETLEIARGFPARIFKIPPHEFGHGKTRNLALEYATGDFIVFLSQDALPYDDQWLGKILEPFRDEAIAGAFSRQIPYPNAGAAEGYFYRHHFPDRKIIRSHSGKGGIRARSIFFSNASSCIRRDILEKYPFNPHIMMCEDQDWAKRVLADGHSTVYTNESAVIHSHGYGLEKTFRRYFDSALSLKQILGSIFRELQRAGATYMFREFLYVARNRPSSLLRTLSLNLAKISGVALGSHSHLLPTRIKIACSMHQHYWRG